MSWIVRYACDEAASGSAPVTLLDGSATEQNLTLAYDSGEMAYTEDGTGRGLNISVSTRTSLAGASAAANAALIAALLGRQKFTVYLKVVSGFIGADSYTNIFEVSVGGTALFYVRAGGSATRTVGFAGHEIVTSGASILAICIDTTQAVAADRVRAYRSDTATPAAVTILTNTLALDDAIADLAGGLVWFLNIPTGNRNPSGTTKFFGIWDDADTLEQVTATFAALYSDDDADPRPAPSLSFLAAPSIDQITATTYRLSFTSSMTVPYDVIRGTPGQTIADMPDDATFDAATMTGTATASTVMREVFNSQTPETTYPIFVRIGADPYVYGYVEATTIAVSSQILSINGGEPIYRGQTGIIVLWDGGATGTTETTINGVTQANHVVVNDTQTTFDLVWPLTTYGETETLTIDGKTATTPPIEAPAGESVTTLAGYTEAPPETLDFVADAVDGNQVVIVDQGGLIVLQPDGTLIIYPGAVSPLEFAIVDHTDGTHSAFAEQPFTIAAGATPDPANLGANVTGAEPNTEYTGTDTLTGDGLDAGVNKTITATGSMQVSTTAGTGWTTSIVRQKTQAWYWRMFSPALGETATGGVTIEGIASVKTITSRAANAPGITTQPANQSVTSGAVATFTVAATNAESYQWQKDTAGNGTYANISGATAATYARTTSDVDLGTSNVRCVVTSSEGASTTSTAATLTVIPGATRITIIPGLISGRGVSLAGTNNVPVNVRNADGTLRYSTVINYPLTGPAYLDNNQNPAVGVQCFYGFPSSIDGTEALFSATVTAVS